MDDRERKGLDMLAETGTAMVAGVERALPGWAARRAAALGASDEVVANARLAGSRAAARIAAELEALFALDPDEQRWTPLQVVRTAYREITPVLEEAGLPPAARDEFAQRAFPDDRYGLAPDTLADLGDDELAPLHIAWGVAKATVHRARHEPGQAQGPARAGLGMSRVSRPRRGGGSPATPPS